MLSNIIIGDHTGFQVCDYTESFPICAFFVKYRLILTLEIERVNILFLLLFSLAEINRKMQFSSKYVLLYR
jgi:hypothetical protein